jgi:hypothetical protein
VVYQNFPIHSGLGFLLPHHAIARFDSARPSKIVHLLLQNVTIGSQSFIDWSRVEPLNFSDSVHLCRVLLVFVLLLGWMHAPLLSGVSAVALVLVEGQVALACSLLRSFQIGRV